jgi:AcrR family transcriptional regulator
MSKSDQSLGTRASIIDASRHLFADQGYQGTGVALICETAGVSKGAFYHHFASKQAVLETIFQDWLRGLEPALDLWKDDPRPVPQVLLTAAAAARPAFSGADRSRRLLLELWSQAARDAELAGVARAPYQRYHDGLKTMLDRGVRQGTLRKHDTTTGARVLVALAVGALLQSLLDRASHPGGDRASSRVAPRRGHPEEDPEGDPGDDDWGRVVTEGVSMLLRGIAKES